MKKSALPNMFTLGNLACGFMSIIMTFNATPDDVVYYRWACIFIFSAAILDRYDGRVARFLQVSSDIGKELDSLADLVSFCVAPSILIFNLYHLSKFGIAGCILAVTFPLAGAYRLARYNTTQFAGVFTGIPTTIAGIIIAIYAFIAAPHAHNPLMAIFLLLTFSYLMVSKLKLKKV